MTVVAKSHQSNHVLVLGDLNLDQALATINVGATGLEPVTSWSRTKRSTKLSHAPIRFISITKNLTLGKRKTWGQ
jgi:hypothetical protein